MYEGRSKSSKPDPERRAMADHFFCSNTQQFLIKQEKIIQTCLNFDAGEAHAKVKDEQLIKNLGVA